MTTLENDILSRLRYLEDVHSIQQLVAAYGPAADSCNEEVLRRFWSDEAIYDIGVLGTVVGKDALMAVYGQDAHQKLVTHGSGHVGSIPYISVSGDAASAIHYVTLYRHRDEGFELFRLVAAYWTFGRTESGRWEATSRVLRSLDGSQEARDLLHRVGDAPGSAA